MEDLLIKTIEQLKYPIFRQGTLGTDEMYPETFFTFWNNGSDDGSHYNNRPNNYIWDFDLNVYSIEPEKPYELLLEAKEALIKENFIVGGNGYDIASDEPTHTGRGINVQYIE